MDNKTKQSTVGNPLEHVVMWRAKFVACNQWNHEGLNDYQISLFDVGYNCDKSYGQGNVYTIGVTIFGFACGLQFMINHKDT
jgi:hypothetical protein